MVNTVWRVCYVHVPFLFSLSEPGPGLWWSGHLFYLSQHYSEPELALWCGGHGSTVNTVNRSMDQL